MGDSQPREITKQMHRTTGGYELVFSPLLLALLHQHDLGGTRCRPLSLPALIDEHVRVFVRAYGARNVVAGG